MAASVESKSNHPIYFIMKNIPVIPKIALRPILLIPAIAENADSLIL